MLTKIINFFAFCVIYEVVYVHSFSRVDAKAADLNQLLADVKADLDKPIHGTKTNVDQPLDNTETDVKLPQADTDTDVELPQSDTDTDVELPQSDTDTDVELPQADTETNVDMPQADTKIDLDLVQHHFPSSLNNGKGEVKETEIGSLERYTELECFVMCGIFRGRKIEKENPDKVEYIQQLAETNLILAIEEARKTFNPVLRNYEPFVKMEVEGSGLSKPLFHCPQLEWKTAEGLQPMRDFYITVSDVDENVPLCFEKIGENKVALTAAETEITFDKIPSVIEDLEELFGNKKLEQAAVDYKNAGYPQDESSQHSAMSWESTSSTPVSVAA